MSESSGEYRACPGCGVRFERRPWALDRDLRASPECWQAYCEVERFAREHRAELDERSGEDGATPGGAFVAVRQLAADAYHAQHAGAPTPPGEVARGLVGLHLTLERDSPRDVLDRARERLTGPDAPRADLTPPATPAPVTIADVLHDGVETGSVEEYRAAVRRWATAVWTSWGPQHPGVAALAEDGDAGSR